MNLLGLGGFPAGGRGPGGFTVLGFVTSIKQNVRKNESQLHPEAGEVHKTPWKELQKEQSRT